MLKLIGRNSSNIPKRRGYLQTSGPFKQGKQKAEMGQNRSFTFQQRFEITSALVCIECKIGRYYIISTLIWMQLFFLLL